MLYDKLLKSFFYVLGVQTTVLGYCARTVANSTSS
jgi:hypothetical protein